MSKISGLTMFPGTTPGQKSRREAEFCSTYFLVSKQHRHILNLKLFNFIVRKTSFNMETLKSVVAVMRQHQWLASVDLKDTNFQIGVVLAHCRYLSFHWLLPVWGSALQSVLSPMGLQQDPGATDGLAQVDGGTTVRFYSAGFALFMNIDFLQPIYVPAMCSPTDGVL